MCNSESFQHMNMVSSNGATRGQLRPYLSGRTPPFLLVGLLVILGILGFSYWSLNTQYNDLQIEIQRLQERLRIYAEKRESVEKMNSALQAQMQTYKEENKKSRITLYKRDQDINNIAEQLRHREEDFGKANTQIDNLKSDLEKLESRDKQKEQEISSLQDQAKSLKIENQELVDAKAELQKKLELLQKTAKYITREKERNNYFNNMIPPDEQGDKKEVPSLNPNVGIPPENRDIRYNQPLPETNNDVHEDPKVQSASLNPNVGIPPQNREIRYNQPLPETNNNVHDEAKVVQTAAPESPDVSNIEKIPEVTSKVQLNDAGNGVNDAEAQGAQNPGMIV